ncbi:MAG: polysaccharide deacetylase family protein [Clostridiales bacterium]|nr:polysaccharide deacetylase family protein [Clostridiales bacterium]
MCIIRLKHIIIMLAVILTVSAISFAAHTTVQISSPAEKSVSVPILMYHSILKHSDGNKYTVSPYAFEGDLKFLNNHGYTTVVMQDLIDYVYNGTELPEKPIVLTFDDGFYNNYYYVYPLLLQYNAKAVISIVGSYTDEYTENCDTNPAYAYLSWNTTREMADSGLVEIQNHTYNLHSLDDGRMGCGKKSTESTEEYTAMLTQDINSMQEKCLENLGKSPAVFTYPFGCASDESLDVIKKLGFKASLSCEEGVNELKHDPEQLYLMKRYIRTPSHGAADILQN